MLFEAKAIFQAALKLPGAWVHLTGFARLIKGDLGLFDGDLLRIVQRLPPGFRAHLGLGAEGGGRGFL